MGNSSQALSTFYAHCRLKCCCWEGWKSVKYTWHTSNIVLMPSKKTKQTNWTDVIWYRYSWHTSNQDMPADPLGLRHPACSIPDWKIIHLSIWKWTEIDHNNYKARTLEMWTQDESASTFIWSDLCEPSNSYGQIHGVCVCALLTAWAMEAPEWCCPIFQIGINIVELPFSNLFHPKEAYHIRDLNLEFLLSRPYK